MNLNEIFENKQINKSCWIIWDGETFQIAPEKPKQRRENRELLARVFQTSVEELEKSGISHDQASQMVRIFWIEEVPEQRSKSLPRIVGEDGFLRMYALGKPLNIGLFRQIWKRLKEPLENKMVDLEPIQVGWNTLFFHDIDATPPGLLPKLFPYFRLRKDRELLKMVEEDLVTLSQIEDHAKRKWLTLAVLSHGAAYREIDGVELLLPSFTEKGALIAYSCKQHLIAEGLKTISLFPRKIDLQGIYLCQGTELWPSQPSMLGSIMANFATHGSATEAYAHSWRRIHKHLRDLPGTPLVAGHSMGGSLAMQIGLYSHSLIETAYAFNPPVPNERDYLFYHKLPPETQEKIQVSANLDDFAFWRIGAKIIGNVTLFLGKRRWRYQSVSFWDCALVIPAFIKFIINIRRAFPAHQNIPSLYENWVSVKLTCPEIEKENIERATRFDYLHFFPKLYDPTKNLVSRMRKIFKWGLYEEYLRNEIEILVLHERDLIDTLTHENRDELEQQLKELRRQKGVMIRRLLFRKEYTRKK